MTKPRDEQIKKSRRKVSWMDQLILIWQLLSMGFLKASKHSARVQKWISTLRIQILIFLNRQAPVDHEAGRQMRHQVSRNKIRTCKRLCSPLFPEAQGWQVAISAWQLIICRLRTKTWPQQMRNASDLSRISSVWMVNWIKCSKHTKGCRRSWTSLTRFQTRMKKGFRPRLPIYSSKLKLWKKQMKFY